MTSSELSYNEIKKIIDNDNLEEVYKIIIKNNLLNNHSLMNYAIMYNNKDIVLFLLDNGFDIYNVKILREILDSKFSDIYIDKYIELGIDFNDDRLYKPKTIEVFVYESETDSDYDSCSDYDSDNEQQYQPIYRKIYQPIGYFVKNFNVLKKMVDSGMDIKKNILNTEWSSLKNAIDYGNIEFALQQMIYIDDIHMNNDNWWTNLLNFVSQCGNVGKGADKCYQILLQKEKLMNTGLLPSRKIFDNVKTKWAYQVKQDPGKFRD